LWVRVVIARLPEFTAQHSHASDGVVSNSVVQCTKIEKIKGRVNGPADNDRFNQSRSMASEIGSCPHLPF